MTSLRETIENFQAYILDKDSTIEDSVVGPDEEFRHTRLGVYYEAYSLRLLEILGRAFPAIKQLAGEELFEKLGREYLRDFPSHYFSVRYFGTHFKEFLANTPDIDPLWVEMARFEWALEDATDGKDAAQLTFEEMSTLNPESWGVLTLTTHPSVQMLPFFYPTPMLWQSLLREQEKPELTRQEEPTYWLLWRCNRQTFFRAMNAEQLWMMRAIQQGQTFSQVCEGLCELLEEEKVVPFAAETLRTWITEGVFSEFHLS